MKQNKLSERFKSGARRWLASVWQVGMLCLVAATLAGCSLLQTGTDAKVETSVAETVAAQAPSPTPTTASSPTLPPTATNPPTQVVPATETLEPVLPPTLTPIQFTPVFPTLGPTSPSTSCCNLRVRNQNRSVTLWIGTTLPYGGNFIEPLHYVEFYPGKETWMRIWWCRQLDHNRWSDDDIDDFYEHWKNELRYYCQHRDVFVDEPMKEISVQ